MAYDNVLIPSGATVSIGDTVGGLTDVGVLKGDASLEITYDKLNVKGSKAESLISTTRNAKVVAAFELYQWDFDRIQEMLDGFATVTPVAATIVEDYDQVTVADAFDFNEFIECEFQNADGTVLQIDTSGHPTVSGSTDNALSYGTDFLVVKNGQGKWGIIILDTVPVTTMDQVFTISYDYTPAASKTLKMGNASTNLVAKIVKMEYEDAAGTTVECFIWSATNEAGLKITFFDSSQEEPASLPVSMQGGLDTTRAAGDQLLQIIYTPAA